MATNPCQWETNPNGHQGAVGSEFKIDASYVSPNARDLDMQDEMWRCGNPTFVFPLCFKIYLYIYII